MLFERSFLQDLYDDDYVSLEPSGSSRWLNHYDAVFEYEGHLYLTQYSTGKSETQDYCAYQDAPDMIECPEVWPHKKIVETIEYTTERPAV